MEIKDHVGHLADLIFDGSEECILDDPVVFEISDIENRFAENGREYFICELNDAPTFLLTTKGELMNDQIHFYLGGDSHVVAEQNPALIKELALNGQLLLSVGGYRKTKRGFSVESKIVLKHTLKN